MKRASNKGYFIVLLIIISAVFSVSFVKANPPPNYWPTEGWKVSSPEKQGVDPALLIVMLEQIIKDEVDIDSISIVRNGYLIADIYMYPATNNKKHPLHSCTKSLTSTLVGIAIDKGFIASTDHCVVDFFPEKSINNMGDWKKEMTLEDLLTMRSGLETRDNLNNYGWQGLREMRATKDWTQFVLDRPMIAQPGTTFEYSNLVSFLLTSILQKQTQKDALSFAHEHLFDHLGIQSVQWDQSPKGIYTGYAELWLMPHDMAKLGFLYLHNGQWENKQILSEEWVKRATQDHVSVTPALSYGYQWWVADDCYFAMGYQGQFIFVIPDKNMVVVFTSNVSGKSLFTPYSYLKKYILPAAKSTEPLPVNQKDSQRLEQLVNDLSKKYYYTIEVAQ